MFYITAHGEGKGEGGGGGDFVVFVLSATALRVRIRRVVVNFCSVDNYPLVMLCALGSRAVFCSFSGRIMELGNDR